LTSKYYTLPTEITHLHNQNILWYYSMNSIMLGVFVIQTIVTAILLGISIMALTWIHKLEEISCKCSEDFKRDYIKYFLYIYIVLIALGYLSTIGLLMGFKWGKMSPTVKFLVNILKNLMFIALIINSIFAVIYIYRLKEIDCKCSEDIRREIYYVLNWINVAFIALVVFLSILLGIFGLVLGSIAFFGMKKSGLKSTSF